MSNTLSKLTAVGILVLLISSAWFAVGEPYVDLWQERIARAEHLQRKQAALRKLIQERQIYEEEYRALTGSRGLQEVFLDDKPGALADAKLQRIVKQAVANSGGTLLQASISGVRAESTRVDNGETPDSKSVSVKVLMQGSIESIYRMLHALENGRPLIVVSNLQIVHQKSRYPISPVASATSYKASYDATAFIL